MKRIESKLKRVPHMYCLEVSDLWVYCRTKLKQGLDWTGLEWTGLKSRKKMDSSQKIRTSAKSFFRWVQKIWIQTQRSLEFTSLQNVFS